ncbi:hypothetical protein BDP27DRAFT_1410582 [Rhodocollybia butyracea]|uniref:Uncharacterized protein n=1 Tax=Rhodocollybia butyracea TaxID=206335 RepID=A0A9P5TWS3_9AGAR|nr:hypothetical protein BDP27DRAFT_1410582 [Rhodocollybia butyracea]
MPMFYDYQLLPPFPIALGDDWCIQYAFAHLTIARHTPWKDSPVTQQLNCFPRNYLRTYFKDNEASNKWTISHLGTLQDGMQATPSQWNLRAQLAHSKACYILYPP